jgi:hypothetical protein
MRGSEAVFGYEVTYTSDGDAFTTNQVHKPVDGRFYRVNIVRPVVFETTPGWKIDASDQYVPTAIGPTGQRVPLNSAIQRGFVTTREKWERADGEPQIQAIA